jgi:hypothetical protein
MPLRCWVFFFFALFWAGARFNQSYAHSYERAFRPALAAAGGRLSVRNHAMGGNSITPSHFCAVAQLDRDGDLDLVPTLHQRTERK